MKKILFFHIFLIIFCSNSYAFMSSDIYSQQIINHTYIDSGYSDVMLYENGKNHVLDTTANFIMNYILDNMSDEDSKVVSKKSIVEHIDDCDHKYEINVIENTNIEKFSTALKELRECRHKVYSKNISMLIKETAKFRNGKYYYLLNNLFGMYTNTFINKDNLTIEYIVDNMAKSHMISFTGIPFLNTVQNISMENIKCENSHQPVDIIDDNNNPVNEIHIGKNIFLLKACKNQNDNSYFKYINIWKKSDTGYTLFDRVPLYQMSRQLKDNNINNIKVNIDKNNLSIYEFVNTHIKMLFEYKIMQNTIYLKNYVLINDNQHINIYGDNIESDNKLTTDNISLKFFEHLIKNYCINNKQKCRSSHINLIIPQL